MMVTALGAAWVVAASLVATTTGRGIALADRGGPQQLADVIQLFPPLPQLPPRLSPRAGLATSRRWKRFVRDLRGHGWLVGLLTAAAVCVVAS